jgi:hypothetical protein
MIDESDNERDGRFPQGQHKCAGMLSAGIGVENNQPIPIVWPKDILGDLADAPREGEALLRVLRAIVGPAEGANSLAAIGTRAEELLRQLDPTHEIPAWRQRSKQTRSEAGKKVFARLGIDRIATGRSKSKQAREQVSEGVKDWWRKRKGEPPLDDSPPLISEGSDNKPATEQGESKIGGTK